MIGKSLGTLLLMFAATGALRADERSLNRKPAGARSTSVSHGDQLVLRFKSNPSVDAQVVKLSDLVEVVSWGARADESLLEFPLGPAPQPGKFQDWSASDLVRNLEYRGMDRAKIAWQGADVARLMRKHESSTAVKPVSYEKKKLPAPISQQMAQQAEFHITQVTREYLWAETGERTPWRIAFKLPIEVLASLSNRRNILSVSGGEEPWVGKQRLTYFIKHQGEEFELEMTVDIQLPPTIVVAKRALRRDELLDESCLEYAALPERADESEVNYFSDMSQLVGKRLLRAVSTSVPIARASVGEPIVISSGEFINVESVAGAVVVTAPARALAAGAEGDMINVELIPKRTKLMAMVVGPKLARITGKAVVQETLEDKPPAQGAPAPAKTARNPNDRGGMR